MSQNPDHATTGIMAGIYRHYKGGYYQVLGIAAHSETDEQMVVYVSLNGIELPGPRLRVRPLSMWFDTVQAPESKDFVPRFYYVGPEIPR